MLFNSREVAVFCSLVRFKAMHPGGIRVEIEPAGVQLVEQVIRMCRKNRIQLILVYSPEYREMQVMTKNRPELFRLFRLLSERFGVSLWDYSDWQYSQNRRFFYNSQHLNAEGAAVFSLELATRLAAGVAGSATPPVAPARHQPYATP